MCSSHGWYYRTRSQIASNSLARPRRFKVVVCAQMSDEARASFSSSKLGGRAFKPTWAWLSHAAPLFAGAVSGVVRIWKPCQPHATSRTCAYAHAPARAHTPLHNLPLGSGRVRAQTLTQPPTRQAVVLVGQPFDTIKVRQQVLQQRTLVVLGQCLRHEGLTGLYKGVAIWPSRGWEHGKGFGMSV